MKHKSHPARNGHCRRMLHVLSDSLDRDLRRDLCRRIQSHLRQCPDCRFYVDTLRRTVVLYRGLGPAAVPGPVEARLFKTIRLAGRGRAKPGPKKRPRPALRAKRQKIRTNG